MTSTRNARILVATEVLSDAALVRRLLAEEFDDVSISTDPERGVEDFKARKPEVLVLAFDTLEKAERYYLGLYRRGATVHALPHRTVILCNKDDLRRVFELCKKEYFDDYILFWPMTHDAPRLPMAVHHALRQLAVGKALPANTAELVAQAHRIAELEVQLERYGARGAQRIAQAGHSLREAGQQIGAALDRFGHQIARGDLQALVEVKDRKGFESEIERLKSQQIEPQLRAAADAVTPLQQWASGMRDALAPQIESARSLRSLADQLRPLVMLVDDDEFQHRFLAHVLSGMNLELIGATSGSQALGLLRKRRPDLAFMDFELPDLSGVEVTRRMKAVEQFAGIAVVMVTAHSEKQIVVESLRAGAADFVVKPFDRATVLAKLHKLLGIGE
jgi:CheY-like chemotaxis protein